MQYIYTVYRHTVYTSYITQDDSLIKHLICPVKIYRINYILTDTGTLRLIPISIFIKSDYDISADSPKLHFLP